MFRTTCLVKVTCALALIVLCNSLYLLYSGSDDVLNFLPTILHQPQLESKSLHQPRKEDSFAFLPESEILQGSNNFDAMNISMGKYSKLHMERNTYSLGEEIEVKIILYNGRGQKKRRGGDYLRLWMEDVKAAVSGKFMDNNDGTYSGRVRVMWSGEADIRVMILGRREEIALMYQLYNKYHSSWNIYAGFRNGSVVEKSMCSVAPFDFTQKWCNFTAENARFPWFCIEPKKPGLSCRKWHETSSEDPRCNLPVLKEWTRSDEWELLQKRTQRISGAPNREASPVTPCNKVTPDVTWNRKSPQGFFYEDQWHSTQCTDTLNHTPTEYGECLRGRTLYLHGDSTSQQLIKYMNEIFNLKSRSQGHNPLVTSDPKYNFTLSWYAHEFPFYHGRGPFSNSVHLAQHILLDRIKNNSRDIIILYLYVHFARLHPDVYQQHVQRLVQSARDLISRAPGVTIAVRGPHAFMKFGKHPLLQSYWGLQYMDILHKEFASLKKNVLYLDYWDLTMARLPEESHPPKTTIIAMVRYMMSIICNRHHLDNIVLYDESKDKYPSIPQN